MRIPAYIHLMRRKYFMKTTSNHARDLLAATLLLATVSPALAQSSVRGDFPDGNLRGNNAEYF